MRYSSSRIQQDTRLESVDYLIHMVRIGRLDPNPAVVSLPNLRAVKKSHIVESLILGLPVEMIWAEQGALGKTQLLSGFEVISSILDFINNSFPLKNLRMLKHLEGFRFSEIDFVEQKHFMQMDVTFGIIHYDSDPMLKCLFVESINKDKFGVDASQIARNIIFKKAYHKLEKYVERTFYKFDYDMRISRSKFERYTLKLQTEILCCLLVIYIWHEKDLLNSSFAMESYSYSRSHISNYDDVNINFNDDINSALNKIMFMLEMDERDLSNNFEYLDSLIDRAFRNNIISMGFLNKSFLSSSISRANELSLAEYIACSISNRTNKLKLNGLSSVGELMDNLKND